MKLEFDSVEDLAYFLDWADKYRNAGALGMIGVAVDTAYCASAAVDDGPLPTIDAAALPARSAEEIEAEGRRQFAAVLQPTAEPAKRKRRTKAEIEADETAAAEAAAAELAKAQQTGQVQPESGTTSPTGANPFDQPSTLQDVGAEGQAATDASSESDVVTPFQHLTRAREFIAKHGMPKYNESFAKAGLDANVMGYTAYQRGVHMSALGELEKV